MHLTKEKFARFVRLQQKERQRYQLLKSVGVDIDCNDNSESLESLFLDCVFTPTQKELIEWWLYDCPDGITGTVNVDKTHIYVNGAIVNTLDTVEALYDYLTTLEID
jgi:hypothetical protein